MKTPNHALRTILLALAFFGTATTATAYDFMVNGIYYNIINDNESQVTYRFYNNSYSYYNDNTGYVIIPESVTYNGKTYTVTSIGDHAFCHYQSESITGISIPNTVTVIERNAFYDCYGLTEIVIPESVIRIGYEAFRFCSGLSDVVIPNSVTSIGSCAFANCDLKSIVIGSSVTALGDNAIGLAGLANNVTCLAEIPPTVASNSNCFSNYSAPLYVPLVSIEAYRTTFDWNYFTDVRGFGENYFSMPDMTTFHGDSIVIPISMENVDEITAFQTDIYLPEGFELLTNNGEYQVELSDRKGRDHVIMANDAADGAIRVLSYSPTLKTFKNNDGELFYLTVKVPDDADGNYRLELNNTIVTTIDEEEIHALNAWNNVMVFSYTMGDVDGSGDITVADIVQTARYILNYNPEPFIFDAADINGDGNITITDVVKIAHMVLDADYDEPTLGTLKHSFSNDRLDGEMVGNTVSIALNNAQEFTAFQLDLTLPERMTANDFALTERASALNLNVKDRGNGKIRLIGYALDLKTITGNMGDMLTFKVAGEGAIHVDGIQLVTPEGQTTRLSGFVIAKDNATSVNEVVSAKEIDHVDYYNLAGQHIERLESGVTLIVTTYTDGTRSATKVIK